MTVNEKYEALLSRLAELGSVLVAYSGGVDSTLLAVTSQAVLGERALAVLAVSDLTPPGETEAARALATELGLSLLEVETYELADPCLAANGPDRCYHCKGELFGLLRAVAEARGLEWVADGANADDRADHRPGHRAALENHVVSPLDECDFTKGDIREAARMLCLPNWDKPSMACLASRVPYGTPIDDALIERIVRAETALAELGFAQMRVRAHGELARVEVGPDELDRAFEARAAITAATHDAGFAWSTLDLDGYRTGSMNATLPDEVLERS